MISIKKLKPSDQLDKIVRFWNNNVILDPITIEILKEKTFSDPDFDADLNLLVEESGEILSFMQGVIRTIASDKKMGWIKLFATDTKRRRQRLATTLFQQIEQKMKNDGVTVIRLIDSVPNYFQPGLDPRYTEAIAFSHHHGFKRFADTANMEVDLEHQDFKADLVELELASQGIFIQRAKNEDLPLVLELLNQYFDHWIPEVKIAFENNPISLHIAQNLGKVIAFSAYDTNNLNTGWFGPMGTDPECRGKGIGRVLLKRCLNDIKNQGHNKAIIPWEGPISFYLHHVNAKVTRVFWRYEKEM
jgi:mycothiol synthase